jgi:Peptidase family C25
MSGPVMTSAGPLLVANGVDATTGEYLLPPMGLDEVARAAHTTLDNPASIAALRARHRRATEAVYAPKQGVDPRDLAQTGWGIVFAADADPAVRAALRPLLEHRRDQATTIEEHRYRAFSGADGYRRGESKQEFMRRHGSGPGPVDPDVVSYYLLLVGGPDEIPFEVQYQLDVQHAVGRVHFDDVAGYARYAESVVAAESRPAPTKPANLVFFAARNDGDPATALSAQHLVDPLAAALGNDTDRWQVRSVIGDEATREGLRAMLDADPPDVLFTATHGVGLPSGHPEQRTAQGGLVCQDWPGPGRGRIAKEHWFDARDVPSSDLTGMVAFLFACFGAGTPEYDDFDRTTDHPRALAPDPFVAALPQVLLGRDGGALAVVGHVDRAWGYSFVWPGAGRQTEVYRSTLAELGAGQPVGSALEYVGDRYAELATDLGLALEEIRLGWRADDEMLAGLWTACRDARGFVLLGDPAVRLAQAPAQPPGATTRTAPVRVTGTKPWASVEHVEPEALSPPRQEPVEVATYVTDDPAGIAYDPATGRITGARLHLFSSVDLDGTAAHVATTRAQGTENDPALEELHARMLEISLATRRALRTDGREPA